MRRVKYFSRDDLIDDQENKRDNTPETNFTGPFTDIIEEVYQTL